MNRLIKRAPLLSFLLFFVAGCAAQNLTQVRQEAYQAYQTGDYPTAVDKFELLVDKIPRDGELWFRLGNAYAKAMLPEQAVQAYQNALLRDPALGKAWYNLGLIHMQAALKAFVDMQQYVDDSDPAFVKADTMRDALFPLLGSDNERKEQE